MTFNEVLSQTIAMLQQHGRVSYRALKCQFALDDAFLDLLALAFQRTAGGENFLREIGGGVGEWRLCGSSAGAGAAAGTAPVSLLQMRPRPASSCISG